MQDEFPKKGEIVYLEDLPENVMIAPDAVFITKVDVPVYLPDGTIGGKARIIEGEGEDAVLIELETTNPIIALLFKTELIGMSIFYHPSNPFQVSD